MKRDQSQAVKHLNDKAKKILILKTNTVKPELTLPKNHHPPTTTSTLRFSVTFYPKLPLNNDHRSMASYFGSRGWSCYIGMTVFLYYDEKLKIKKEETVKSKVRKKFFDEKRTSGREKECNSLSLPTWSDFEDSLKSQSYKTIFLNTKKII